MTLQPINDLVVGEPHQVAAALATQHRLGLLIKVGEPVLRPDGLAEVPVIRHTEVEPDAAGLVVDWRDLAGPAVALVAAGCVITLVVLFWREILAAGIVSFIAYFAVSRIRRSK